VSAGVRRTVAVLVVLLLVGSPVQALITPDPIESGLLAKIAAALRAIHEFRMHVQRELQEQLQTRIDVYAYPQRLFDPIRAATSTVIDIRREMQQLACDWHFSPRTAGLREALRQRTQFCRSRHHQIWGSHETFWDAPLQEANDYVATMTANMLSERAERTSTSWVRAHKDLFDEHMILRSSPGEANRAEAAALGWANQVANGNAQIVTQQLLVRQMTRDLERFDQKKAADVTYYLYRSLGTLARREWRSSPPEPGDEDIR
jgi:hypothetical protein